MCPPAVGTATLVALAPVSLVLVSGPYKNSRCRGCGLAGAHKPVADLLLGTCVLTSFRGHAHSTGTLTALHSCSCYTQRDTSSLSTASSSATPLTNSLEHERADPSSRHLLPLRVCLWWTHTHHRDTRMARPYRAGLPPATCTWKSQWCFTLAPQQGICQLLHVQGSTAASCQVHTETTPVCTFPRAHECRKHPVPDRHTGMLQGCHHKAIGICTHTELFVFSPHLVTSSTPTPVMPVQTPCVHNPCFHSQTQPPYPCCLSHTGITHNPHFSSLLSRATLCYTEASF